MSQHLAKLGKGEQVAVITRRSKAKLFKGQYTCLNYEWETSKKLDIICKVETPPTQKRMEVAWLVQRRYDELIKEGKIPK